MKGNDIAACLVIALGVGGVLAGSLSSPLPHRSLPPSRSLSWRPCAFPPRGMT